MKNLFLTNKKVLSIVVDNYCVMKVKLQTSLSSVGGNNNNLMRLISIIIFCFIQIYTFSQEIHITDISDTINVKYNEWDSLYYLKYEITGNWKVFYDTECKLIATIQTVKNDTFYFEHFYKNGNIKRRCIFTNFYSKKRKELSDAWWYENGQLNVDVNFSSFPCIVKNYYRNGQQRMEFYYIDEWLTVEGEYKEWYENGKLKSTGFYKDNEKDGIWKYYKKNGDLEKTEIYDNGKLIRTE